MCRHLFLLPAMVSGALLNVTGFGAHIEGAAVDPAGMVYAVHYRNDANDTFDNNMNVGRNVIGQVDPSTGVSKAYFTGEASASYNGIRFSADGASMYLADVGQKQVTKVDRKTMTGTKFCGDSKMDGIPNDLALAKNGNLFLSGQVWDGPTGGTGALWLCTADGSATLLEGPMNRTNGIALSPDDMTLYLTEAAGSPVSFDTGVQRIWKYDLWSNGSFFNKRLHFDFGVKNGDTDPEATVDSDGMRTDIKGNLYVTRNGKQKVTVITPEGSLKKEIPLANIVNPTNLEMGGADGTTIYVVGRCGTNGWGAGDGCIEHLSALNAGRQFDWFSAAKDTTAAPAGNTTDSPSSSASFASFSLLLLGAALSLVA